MGKMLTEIRNVRSTRCSN